AGRSGTWLLGRLGGSAALDRLFCGDGDWLSGAVGSRVLAVITPGGQGLWPSRARPEPLPSRAPVTAPQAPPPALRAPPPSRTPASLAPPRPGSRPGAPPPRPRSPAAAGSAPSARACP